MPFVNSFTASQIIGLPGTVVLTNTSTGSDPSITERRVYLEDANGNYLKPEGTTTDYVVWPLNENPFRINCLKVDKAPNVTVQYLSP